MSLLDRLRETYPDSPEIVRLKAALLFAGVQYDPCLPVAGEWAFPAYMPYQLPVGVPAYKGQRRIAMPYLARFPDGTQSRIRVKADSPFRIAANGDGHVLLNNGDSLGEITFEPRLAWADSLTADGTPMRATGLSQHGDMMVLNVAPGCEYFVVPREDGSGKTDNKSCTFCMYGLPDKQRLEPLGQELYKIDLPTSTMDRVTEACSHPDTHARHLYLVGGSMLKMADEGARFVTQARRLAEAGLHERYYIACGSGALEREHMLQLKDAGVRGASFNLEVWDPAQFSRICPGKDSIVGRDRWIASLEEAVDIFGRGNVLTAFVGGAELEGEGCFADPQQALESNLEGGRWLIDHGIQPVFSLHWKMTGKARGEEPIYSLDNFLRLNEGLAKHRRQADLLINSEFFCKRCAYMQLEPDYDAALA